MSEEKVDYSNTGVDDRIERIGEMILASVGTAFCIAGNLMGVLEGKWAILGLIASYALYQSTTIARYIKYVK